MTLTAAAATPLPTASFPDLDAHYPLTPAQIDSFRSNGFIKLKDVFSPQTLQHYGAEITRQVALFNKQTEFVRTPKYHIEAQADEWIGKKYRQSFFVQPMIEMALGLYFTATVTNTQTQDRREWRITYKCKGVDADSAELKTLFVAF